MAHALIIAYGNPFRCDDGLAWKVAERLAEEIHSRDVEIVTLQQLTPELAAAVCGKSLVLFVDAARGGIPGDISIAKLGPKAQVLSFTHHFSPSTVLGLAKELYGALPDAYQLSVCGECFAHGEALSETVTRSLPALVRGACDLIS